MIRNPDPVYEIFTVRSILSLRLDSTELNIMLLDRLRTIGIEYRNDLEPTHLCNNIRGLCEALETMKESVSENPKGPEFWIGLEPLFEARDTNQYIAEQYIANININIGFPKIAISISILNYCWQYIANILIEQ